MEEKPCLTRAPAYRFVAFALILFPYLLVYSGVQIISSLGPEIMHHFGIGESSLSFLSSIGTLSKAFFSLFAGMIATKIGGRRALSFGLFSMALAGVLYYLSRGSYTMLCMVRVLHGFSCGQVATCCLSINGTWFPKKERGISTGCLSGMFGISTSLVTLYCFGCTQSGMTWYSTLSLMLIAGGVVVGAVVMLLLRTPQERYGVVSVDQLLADEPAPEQAPAQSSDDALSGRALPSSWREALRSRSFYLIMITLGLYGGSSLSVGFIMPLFLSSVGFDASQVAAVMSIGTSGSIIFAVLGGIISDRFFASRRAECVLIGFGCSALFYSLMCAFGSRLTVSSATVLYFLAYGFLHIAAGPAWALPSEAVGKEFVVRSNGFSQLCSSGLGFLVTVVSGSLIQYTGAAYGMILLAVVTALVALGGLLIKLIYHY